MKYRFKRYGKSFIVCKNKSATFPYFPHRFHNSNAKKIIFSQTHLPFKYIITETDFHLWHIQTVIRTMLEKVGIRISV